MPSRPVPNNAESSGVLIATSLPRLRLSASLEPCSDEPFDGALFPVANRRQLRGWLASDERGIRCIERVVTLGHARHPACPVRCSLEEADTLPALLKLSLPVDYLAHAVELAAQRTNHELGVCQRLEPERAFDAQPRFGDQPAPTADTEMRATGL